MRIGIERQGDNMILLKDYSSIQDKSEIAHVITELELIKLELINIWDEWEDELIEDNHNGTDDDSEKETTKKKDSLP